ILYTVLRLIIIWARQLLLLDIFISAFQKADVIELYFPTPIFLLETPWNCKLWGHSFCQIGPDVGPCKENFTRNCEEFIYGGCGGNKNNFETLDQCRRDKLSYFVLSLSYVSPEICTLPPKVGKCKAWFLRFYFNAATGNCEGFIYGGCEGNKNNFETLGQCRATCQRSGKEEILIFASFPTPIFLLETPWNCKLRARKGKCKGKIPRYYYDAFNKRCRLFTYSGCGGNANNFQTFDQCNKACDAFGTLKQFYIPTPRIN
uniref:BPTI/Kunitz inhibitor domain-containing protein n=1 Tax=Naja naja TaxID=35670 RepID=A0A8C6XC87_NAJNA